MKKDVLGIKINDISFDQAVGTVKNWLSKSDKHFIVTTNPELIVIAQKDLQVKEIINQADLSIPDGKGLKLSGDIVCTTTGIDLMEGLIKLSSDYGFTVGFLGGGEGIAEVCAKRLSRKYPNLKISFAGWGGEVDEAGEVINELKNHKSLIVNHQSLPEADLLFVAFGQPKQEKWIYQNLDKIPVKVAMGVGGSFDYLSGKVPRAPIWVRRLGLEWLFRLILQPWRIKRQLRLVKYLWLIGFPSSGE